MSPVETVKRHTLATWERLPRPLQSGGVVGWQAARLWTSEDGTELGAAVAFYSMFALAPLLVIAIAIAGAVFGPDAARGHIVSEIGGLVGPDAARSIEAMIASAWMSQRAGVAALLGVGTLLLAASGVFAELRKALNRVGRVKPMRSALTTYVRARLIAFALVLGFGFLFVASLLLSAALSGFAAWLSARMPVLSVTLNLLDIALSLAVLTVAFWGFLRWLPDQGPRSRSAWTGAVVSALLFSVGKHLIGLYLSRVSTLDSFGAAGSLVVVLMWVFYSSQILLYGAAVAYVLDGVRAEDPRRDSVVQAET